MEQLKLLKGHIEKNMINEFDDNHMEDFDKGAKCAYRKVVDLLDLLIEIGEVDE